MLSDDQRFIVTRMLTFDERKQDWLVQPFGLRRLERLDAIQAERVSFSPQHFKCYLQVCVMTYRKIPKISPGAYIFSKALFGGPIFGGAYIWRGDLTEGFLRYRFGGLIFEGLIHGGAYFRNFTVFPPTLIPTNAFTMKDVNAVLPLPVVLILFPLCRKGAIFRI